MKIFLIVALSVAGCSLSATELYNLDFSANDVGTYQTVYGNPTIQSPVGTFANALVFQPPNSIPDYDQIELPFDVTGSYYDIQYDVLTHNLLNSGYGFTVFLDTPVIRSVDLDGNQDTVAVFQPSPYTGENVADFSDGQVYHFDISVDLQANLWTLAIDGTQVFSNPFNASGLQDIRFNLGANIEGASGASGMYAALDNVVVNVVPEPATAQLLIAAGVPLLLWQGIKRRRG
jgi:hypothetical protein